MSILLRHPRIVPALFSREAEDASRSSFEPLRALTRRLPFAKRPPAGRRRRPRRLASKAPVLIELPLIVAASTLLGLILHA